VDIGVQTEGETLGTLRHAMVSAGMTTWATGHPTVWPRAFLLLFPGRGRLSAGARCTERGNLPVVLLLSPSPLLKWHGKIDLLWLDITTPLRT
jgi:hypothetical protein